MTNPPAVKHLRVKLFADGADRASMLALYARPEIEGFTTNPTLMAKAGITDYEAFSRDILATIADKPLSLEVFSDDFAEMERQARKIAAWGGNVYVKIPITNTRGESSGPLIKRLAHSAGEPRSCCARLPVGICRPDCRYGPRPGTDGGGKPGVGPVPSSGGNDLGQPPRTALYLPRRSGRLSHHHGDG